MLRSMLALALSLAGVHAIAAQDPASLPDLRMAGTWRLDRKASESVPENLRELVSAQPIATPGVSRPATQTSRTVVGTPGAAGAGPVTVVGTAPGGRIVSTATLGADGYIRSGSSQSDSASAGSPRGTPLLTNATAPRVAAVQVEMFMAEIPPERMVLVIENGKTRITADAGSVQEWITDKKERRMAEGAVAAMESSWWLKSLQTIRTIDSGSEVQRDFKVSNDGKTLEVKTHLKVAGKKTEVKLKYIKEG